MTAKILERPDDNDVVDMLRRRVEQQPDAPALSFLERGEIETDTLTYRELDQRARAVAAMLQAEGLAGGRALLMYPPGLDFLVAFWGCLYSGTVAVPAYPPEMHRLEHAVRRLRAIIADARTGFVLTTDPILAMAQHLATQVAGADLLMALPRIATSDVALAAAGDWVPPTLARDTLAFLQYTSGPTGYPKGVMVSHGNVLDNAWLEINGFGVADRSVEVLCWVPLYHDLGLVGHSIFALYRGGRCRIMSPVDFLEKPVRWLAALSRYGATLTAGPNFAFELCLNKITPEQRDTLDLSRVEIIGNCAEPVSASTIERFHAYFAPCGLRREAILPAYGLAEATIFVTSAGFGGGPVVTEVDRDAIGRDPRDLPLRRRGSGCRGEPSARRAVPRGRSVWRRLARGGPRRGGGQPRSQLGARGDAASRRHQPRLDGRRGPAGARSADGGGARRRD